jgi:general secretion pathway protein A
MYERFFQLRERPFALSPDPDYLFPSRVHREALSYLRYGIESQAGFVVITGEIGSGKTTLLQALLRGLDGQTTVIRLMNTLLEPRELLEAIAIDLGFEAGTASKPMLLHQLAGRLVEERSAGRLALLVIDEAQNLGLPALEEIRMLSNLETEKSKLLQIVLVGQPDLRDKLHLPVLEQLRQRITVSYHLAALDAGETEAYINHRLRRAALAAPLQFPRDVTDRVHERARGVPRLINVICDAALVFAYAEERGVIDNALIEEALRELEATGVLPTGEQLSAVTDTHTQLERTLPAGIQESGEPVDQIELARPAVAVAQDALPPPAPSADVAVERAQELIEKEVTLRMREEQLSHREAQLARQRQILAEEYRLFRTRTPLESPRAAGHQGDGSPWPPSGAVDAGADAPAHRPAPADAPSAPSVSIAAYAERRAPVAGPRPLASPPPRRSVQPQPYAEPAWREDAPPRRRFWRRVRQVLFGYAEPVTEDRR